MRRNHDGARRRGPADLSARRGRARSRVADRDQPVPDRALTGSTWRRAIATAASGTRHWSTIWPAPSWDSGRRRSSGAFYQAAQLKERPPLSGPRRSSTPTFRHRCMPLPAGRGAAQRKPALPLEGDTEEGYQIAKGGPIDPDAAPTCLFVEPWIYDTDTGRILRQRLLVRPLPGVPWTRALRVLATGAMLRERPSSTLCRQCAIRSRQPARGMTARTRVGSRRLPTVRIDITPARHPGPPHAFRSHLREC